MMLYSFDKVIFISNWKHILVVDLKIVNLDHTLNEDGFDSIIDTRFLVWCSKFEKRKSLKKDK